MKTITPINWTDDLNDVPTLSGPLMPPKGALTVPNYDLLEQTYRAAGWRWCRELWETRPANETWQESLEAGSFPTAKRIRHDLEKSVAELSLKVGDYHQYCGFVIFRAKSGRPGCIIEWVLAEHLIRLKAGAKIFGEHLEIMKACAERGHQLTSVEIDGEAVTECENDCPGCMAAEWLDQYLPDWRTPSVPSV